MEIETEEVALWALSQLTFITGDQIQAEFNCSKRRAIDLLRNLRVGKKYRTKTVTTTSKYGRPCYAVKVEGYRSPENSNCWVTASDLKKNQIVWKDSR